MDEQGAAAELRGIVGDRRPDANEAENVETVVELLLLYARVPVEILFVYDGSTDGTRERVRALSVTKPVRFSDLVPRSRARNVKDALQRRGDFLSAVAGRTWLAYHARTNAWRGARFAARKERRELNKRRDLLRGLS